MPLHRTTPNLLPSSPPSHPSMSHVSVRKDCQQLQHHGHVFGARCYQTSALCCEQHFSHPDSPPCVDAGCSRSMGLGGEVIRCQSDAETTSACQTLEQAQRQHEEPQKGCNAHQIAMPLPMHQHMMLAQTAFELLANNVKGLAIFARNPYSSHIVSRPL